VYFKLTSITDDGASYIDEPPETPAPLFAVRAFKTAIFGTPHPYQREYLGHERLKEEEKGVGRDAPREKSEGARVKEVDDALSLGRIEDEPAAQPRLDPLASPAKGILLTPGTAATRRKTVSFGMMEQNKQGKENAPVLGNSDQKGNLAQTKDPGKQDVSLFQKPRRSTLTKTLIELSKQRPTKEDIPDNTISVETKRSKRVPSNEFQTDSVLGLDADTTMDLNQPRSRSGQHWKTEYDRYQKRSNREMKKIIKYGQNVKSYAVKKDSEAMRLGQKLQKEMVKTATFEAKPVSTTRLDEDQGVDGQSDTVKPVAELGPETARTTTHKEAGVPDPSDAEPQISDIASLHRELSTLRQNAKTAGDQTAKLQQENAALKQSLARVKEEMMSYETRRQTREERMKKREAKHKAAREICERKLAELTVEHQELLRVSTGGTGFDIAAEIRSIQQEGGMQIAAEDEQSGMIERPSTAGKENFQPKQTVAKAYISPRKPRQQNPSIDIWTQNIPNSSPPNAPTSQEQTSLPPSSVKRDLHRTLREIDQNLIPARHQEPERDVSKPQLSSQKPAVALISQPSHPPTRRKSTLESPRPSMISMASSPLKLPQPSQPDSSSFPHSHTVKIPPSRATTGRSASLLSKAGSRTSTMGSGRGGLTAERVSAAKARLRRRREGRGRTA